MIKMKETSEIVIAFFAVFAQSVKTFADGFQLIEITDFFDEALLIQVGVEGLEKIKEEHLNATYEDIEALYVQPKEMLDAVGFNPMVTGAIISAFKGINYGLSGVLKSNGKIQSDDMKVVNNLEAINNRFLKSNDLKKTLLKKAG